MQLQASCINITNFLDQDFPSPPSTLIPPPLNESIWNFYFVTFPVRHFQIKPTNAVQTTVVRNNVTCSNARNVCIDVLHGTACLTSFYLEIKTLKAQGRLNMAQT